MARLCERPGCAQPATVAYGMSADTLSVWLEPFDGAAASRDPRDLRHNVLCRRHADAMIVPKGWTLDDRREAVPRLFKAPDAPPPSAPRQKRQRVRRGGDDTGQLEFTVSDIVAPPAVPPAAVADERGVAESEPAPVDTEPSADRTTEAWRPVFDQSDDLDGLLSTNSPLLARAFGKRPRPDDPSSPAPSAAPASQDH